MINNLKLRKAFVSLCLSSNLGLTLSGSSDSDSIGLYKQCDLFI